MQIVLHKDPPTSDNLDSMQAKRMLKVAKIVLHIGTENYNSNNERLRQKKIWEAEFTRGGKEMLSI